MIQSINDIDKKIRNELDLKYLNMINQNTEDIRKKGVTVVKEINLETRMLSSIAYFFKTERNLIEKKRKLEYH